MPSKLNRNTVVQCITLFNNSQKPVNISCLFGRTRSLQQHFTRLGRAERRGEGRGARSPFVQIYQQVTAIRIRFLAPRRTGQRTALLQVNAIAEQRVKELYQDEKLQRNTTSRRETKPPSWDATMERAMLGRFGICCTLLAVSLQGN